MITGRTSSCEHPSLPLRFFSSQQTVTTLPESSRKGTYLWLWILLHIAKLSSKMPVLIYTVISNFLRVAHSCSLVSISYYDLSILANLIGENDISIFKNCVYLITSNLNILPHVFTSYTFSFVSRLFVFYFLGSEYVFYQYV